MNIEKMRISLADSGCSSSEASEIIRMCENGSMKKALHLLRKSRCVLMDELHESGRKVDCLDLLIRRMEKEMKQADIENGGV
jgi:hypothetical protein